MAAECCPWTKNAYVLAHKTGVATLSKFSIAPNADVISPRPSSGAAVSACFTTRGSTAKCEGSLHGVIRNALATKNWTVRRIWAAAPVGLHACETARYATAATSAVSTKSKSVQIECVSQVARKTMEVKRWPCVRTGGLKCASGAQLREERFGDKLRGDDIDARQSCRVVRLFGR